MLPTCGRHVVDQEYAHKIFTAIIENKTDVLEGETINDDGLPLAQLTVIMYFAAGYLKFITTQEE